MIRSEKCEVIIYIEMKKVILSILLALVGGFIWASTIPTNLPKYKAIVRSRTDEIKNISDEAKFYLVTCEPGEVIYERFGHSGIRVYDPITGIDEIFHWGLFSFDTPNFVGRFIEGKTDYEMGVYSTKFFLLQYIDRGSSVYAQELDLTSVQKKELWKKLWENYLPQNRKYRYNFIYDNCATRAYQLIISVYDYQVYLNYDLQQITYRDIINKYVPLTSPFNLMINIIIGKQADRYISTKESVSFPIYTMEALNHTEFVSNNEIYPVVKNLEIIHRASFKEFISTNLFSYGFTIILLILTSICILYTYRKKRYLPYFSQFILFISGLIGIIICYLWFFSDHPLVNNNMNILWCNPLNLVLAILLFIRHNVILRKIKIILSIFSVLSSFTYIIMLILSVQNITIHIFSLWVLVFITTLSVLYTYRNKISILSHK